MSKETQDRPEVTRRRVLSAGTATGVAATLGALAGCGGGSDGSNKEVQEKITNPSDSLNKKGFPITAEPVTLQFMAGRRPWEKHDYNKVKIWEYYEKQSNVHIDWGLVPFDDAIKKANLALGSGDYPEAFYSCNVSATNAGKYGRQGSFIRLNELIDEYMPGLTALMEENKDIKAGMTFPDGSIYALPEIVDPNWTARRLQIKLWVREDWLDKFDMGVPRTLDDYHQYLKAVKQKQPAPDAIGYCDRTHGADLQLFLAGSFGVQNRGVTAIHVDADPSDSDKIRFYPTSDGYKEMLTYMNRLYSEELIAQNIVSIDPSKVLNGVAQGKFGSTSLSAPKKEVGGAGKDMVVVPSLEGPEGDHAFNYVRSVFEFFGAVCVTDKCKHPATLGRWVDYFYTDPGSRLQHMGIEGISYHNTKDGPRYIDAIRNPKDGVTSDEAMSPYLTFPGGGYPGIIKEGDQGAPIKQAAEAAEQLEPDMLEEVWPPFTYTPEETDRLNALSADIDKYVDESRTRFITGQLSLSEWPKYVETIKKMGLDDYIELKQAAYGRYRKNKKSA